MTLSKKERYSNLVQFRKQCSDCQGLVNPSRCVEGRYDSFQIGPWSRWQGNLDDNLMVVGQDWGTTDYFLKWKGLDQSLGNPTNDNLRRLLHSIGVEIHPPGADQRGKIFLTNAILCLKQGNLQAPVRDEWFRNCGRKFLKPQIRIVKPKVVVALGNKAFRTILNAYGIHYAWPRTHRRVVELGCVKLPKEILVFPVYHCGARVMNTHRHLESQLNDWKPIGKALRSGGEAAA